MILVVILLMIIGYSSAGWVMFVDILLTMGADISGAWVMFVIFC